MLNRIDLVPAGLSNLKDMGESHEYTRVDTITTIYKALQNPVHVFWDLLYFCLRLTHWCLGNLIELLGKQFQANFCEIALRWMSQNLTNDKSTLVTIMACCNVYWDICHHMASLGHNESTYYVLNDFEATLFNDLLHYSLNSYWIQYSWLNDNSFSRCTWYECSLYHWTHSWVPNKHLCLLLTHWPLGDFNKISEKQLTHWPLGDFNRISEKKIKLILATDWWLSQAKLPSDEHHWTLVMSPLVQVMAWCHQATSHYLKQCWPRSLLPYGVTRPQSFKFGSSFHRVWTLLGTVLRLNLWIKYLAVTL